MRRSKWARRSSLLGKQQRADARIAAHNESMNKKPMKGDPMGYHLPAPGPNQAGAPKKPPFENNTGAMNWLADVKNNKQVMGLRACAAQGYINKNL